MASFLFRDDDGWPYPDPDVHAAIEVPDHAFDIDDDLMCLRGPHPHLFDALDPLERAVVAGQFGLDGGPVQTTDELGAQLGVSADVVRGALDRGLAKLRTALG